jgi:hypothetical protein
MKPGLNCMIGEWVRNRRYIVNSILYHLTHVHCTAMHHLLRQQLACAGDALHMPCEMQVWGSHYVRDTPHPPCNPASLHH